MPLAGYQKLGCQIYSLSDQQFLESASQLLGPAAFEKTPILLNRALVK
uniref:Uncharacterized protein n=1 Tax=Arundo donax TaxID=35708 RepID=A0A0A9ST43_ARUDO